MTPNTTATTTGTPNSVPTFNIQDSATMQKFEAEMAAYYAPPTPQALNKFDTSDPNQTPDQMMQQNLNFAIYMEEIVANKNEFQRYQRELHNWNLNAGAAALPFPPKYQRVDSAAFQKWWQGYVESGFGGGRPKTTYIVSIPPPPPPIVKTGADAMPPPPPFTTELVGSYYMQGIWNATPFAVASAMMQSDPNSIVIPSPESPTGWFRMYHSAFGGDKAFWIPCASPMK